jgi:quinol-cytochrome oxidoreductase complex cytochrome b subunit
VTFLFCLLQVLSGIYLAFFFQPTPADAWTSLEFIEKSVPLGKFSHSLHRWGAFAVMSFLILHLLRYIWLGAYRTAAKAVWISGIFLLLTLAAFIVSGYLLPWDFRAYWTVKTVGNWLDHLPFFADTLRWLLFTDTPGGVVPVNRWFALHTLVLPLLTAVIVAVHFWNARARGIFGPAQRARAILTLAGATLLLAGLAAFGTQEHNIADPITTSSVPQPDWLYMMFFQVTRYFQDGLEMVGVFWIPAGIVLGLFLLLFVDLRKDRLKWTIFSLSAAAVLLLCIVTYHTCSTSPIWSCASCHKKSFGQAFATAPRNLGAFSNRYDNKWLALHYRYPQYFWMMDAEVPGW